MGDGWVTSDRKVGARTGLRNVNKLSVFHCKTHRGEQARHERGVQADDCGSRIRLCWNEAITVAHVQCIWNNLCLIITCCHLFWHCTSITGFNTFLCVAPTFVLQVSLGRYRRQKLWRTPTAWTRSLTSMFLSKPSKGGWRPAGLTFPAAEFTTSILTRLKCLWVDVLEDTSTPPPLLSEQSKAP